MKKMLTILLILFGFVLTGCHTSTEANQFKPKNNTFWIATDIHFIAPSLHDDGKEFQFIKGTAAGKDLDYQEESLTAFVAKAKKVKPAAIILTGDLTLNGEKQSAKEMAEILAPVKKTGTKILAIPGNHDIFDGWARKYQGDTKERIAQISPTDFKEFFPDGYKLATSTDSASLSYAIKIDKKYDFIFLDTNEYPIQTSRAQPHTGGQIKNETLNWLEKRLQIAESKNKVPILFMHHNLFIHNPLVYKGYVLSNAQTLKSLLAKYQVPVVFSGHIHAQDIMKDPTGKTDITEVVTSSFAIADHAYGELKLTPGKISYHRQTVDVDAWAKENKMTAKNLSQHNAYLKELFFKDGQRLAYQQLLDQNVRDENILAPAAKLVGEVNYNYFTGQDNYSSKKREQIKQSFAYKELGKYSPFLQKYIDSAINDINLADQKLVITP